MLWMYSQKNALKLLKNEQENIREETNLAHMERDFYFSMYAVIIGLFSEQSLKK